MTTQMMMKTLMTMNKEDYEKRRELSDRVLLTLERKIKNDPSCISLNGNGHSLVAEDLCNIRLISMWGFSDEELLKIEKGEKVDPKLFYLGNGSCWYCGEYYHTY